MLLVKHQGAGGIALVEVDFGRLAVAVERVNQVPHGRGAKREMWRLVGVQAGPGCSVGSAELFVALQGLDAVPRAATGDVRPQAKHRMAARRRGGMGLRAHAVHAEDGLAGLLARLFEREFAGAHLRHDVGDEGCAVPEQVVVAEMQREVAKAWATRAIEQVGPWCME